MKLEVGTEALRDRASYYNLNLACRSVPTITSSGFGTNWVDLGAGTPWVFRLAVTADFVGEILLR